MIKADAHFVDSAKEGLTDVHSWSTPSSGLYTEYFVGFVVNPSSVKYILANATSQSSVDTSWATNGYFGYGTASLTNDGVQLEDGRILVPHNDYTITMINTDGSVDTSWGTNGSYVHPDSLRIYKVLVDNDGNFHLFCGVDSRVYLKLSPTGVLLGSLQASVTKIWSFNDAQWSDSTKTRIIAGGTPVYAINVGGTNYYPDLIAINPTTAAIDTAWTGNIGSGGYFVSGTYPSPVAQGIRVLSDGGIVLHRNTSKMLAKVLADGTGFDTSWGDNGQIEFNMYSFGYGDTRQMDNYGDDIFVISRINDGGLQVYFNHVDSNGIIIDTYHAVGADTSSYTLLQVFNDKLILGGNGVGAFNHVEIWSQDFVKENGFDLVLSGLSVDAVNYVILDETTKDYTTGTQSRTIRYPADISHLNGQTVQILGNGTVYPDEVVTNGTVTVTATPLHAGLGYTSTLLPMKLDGEANVKRISKIVLNVNNSVGGNYGRVETDLNSVVLKPTGDVMDVDGALYTGNVELPFDGAYDRQGDIYITQNQCVPMRVVGLGIYLSQEAI